MAWQGHSCAQLDLDADDDEPVRMLCVGGARNGGATADAFVTEVPPETSNPIDVSVLEGLLPIAMADPLIFSDQSALYAQGAGRWVQIDREDLNVTQIATDTLRERGGASVSLGSGVTLLVGGETSEQEDVDSWQIFTPVVAAR
jgi:hypothetical protein